MKLKINMMIIMVIAIIGIKESDKKNPVGISDVYFFDSGVLYE